MRIAVTKQSFQETVKRGYKNFTICIHVKSASPGHNCGNLPSAMLLNARINQSANCCEMMTSPAAQFVTRESLSNFRGYDIRPLRQSFPSLSSRYNHRRPVSTISHQCERAASIRKGWLSVSLGTRTCAPASVH